MSLNRFLILPVLFVLTCSTIANGQTRDEQVLSDRENLINNEDWFYDDLESAIKEAGELDKPLMVVLRCIP